MHFMFLKHKTEIIRISHVTALVFQPIDSFFLSLCPLEYLSRHNLSRLEPRQFLANSSVVLGAIGEAARRDGIERVCEMPTYHSLCLVGEAKTEQTSLNIQ